MELRPDKPVSRWRRSPSKGRWPREGPWSRSRALQRYLPDWRTSFTAWGMANQHETAAPIHPSSSYVFMLTSSSFGVPEIHLLKPRAPGPLSDEFESRTVMHFCRRQQSAKKETTITFLGGREVINDPEAAGAVGQTAERRSSVRHQSVGELTGHTDPVPRLKSHSIDSATYVSGQASRPGAAGRHRRSGRRPRSHRAARS